MNLRWRREDPKGETILGGRPGWILEFVGRKRIIGLARLEGTEGPWEYGQFTTYATSANKAMCGGYLNRAVDGRLAAASFNVSCGSRKLIVQAILTEEPVTPGSPEYINASSLPILYVRACVFDWTRDLPWTRVPLPA